MANKVYITFRKAEYNKGQGEYNPSYILGRQFSDYKGLIDIKDNLFSDNRYTKVNPNGLKNKTKFGYYEYVDGIDQDSLITSINLVASYNAIKVISKQEAIDFIKEKTDLKLIEETTDDNGVVITAKFEISPAGTDINGQSTPAKYLIIN